MQNIDAMQAIVARKLTQRGLPRAPGPLGFVYKGAVVRVSVSESLYRGLYVTIHDQAVEKRQFRAQDGVYDWDAMAECIVAIVERRQAPAPASQSRSGAKLEAPLSIRHSAASPGRLRVKLAEMDLDPVSVMQLYALLHRASPALGRNLPEIDAALI